MFNEGARITEPGLYSDSYFDVIEIKKTKKGELVYCWVKFGNIIGSFSFLQSQSVNYNFPLHFKKISDLFALLYL